MRKHLWLPKRHGNACLGTARCANGARLCAAGHHVQLKGKTKFLEDHFLRPLKTDVEDRSTCPARWLRVYSRVSRVLYHLMSGSFQPCGHSKTLAFYSFCKPCMHSNVYMSHINISTIRCKYIYICICVSYINMSRFTLHVFGLIAKLSGGGFGKRKARHHCSTRHFQHFVFKRAVETFFSCLWRQNQTFKAKIWSFPNPKQSTCSVVATLNWN